MLLVIIFVCPYSLRKKIILIEWLLNLLGIELLECIELHDVFTPFLGSTADVQH